MPEELVINNVLSYIASARQVLNSNEVINNAKAFYEDKAILEAKDDIYKLINEHLIRRKTADKIKQELKDIMDAFTIAEANSIAMPTFVAQGLSALPPSTGFEALATLINGLKDEITTLNGKMSKLDQIEKKHNDLLQECSTIKKDIQEIKQNSAFSKSTKDAVSIAHDQNGQPRQYTDAARKASLRSNGPPRPKNGSTVIRDQAKELAKYETRNLNSNKTHANGESGHGVPGASSTESTDDGGWQTKQPRGRRGSRPLPRTYSQPKIVGKRKNTSFKAIERYYDVFVGGCQLDMTEEKLKDYCNNDLKIAIYDCNELKIINNRYKCFKISLTLENRNEILNADYWPENTWVKKFYRTRSNEAQN